MLAVEDVVSEQVARRIVAYAAPVFQVAGVLRRNGKGYLEAIFAGLNAAAQGMPYFVLADQDACTCPAAIVRHWLGGQELSPNMVLRIAVREVEAWLLADAAGFARFARLAIKHVPDNPEAEVDAKRALINAVRRSQSSALRRDIVPRSGSSARQGPNYNGRMIEYLQSHWDIDRACQRSPSLSRAVGRVRELEERWQQ